MSLLKKFATWWRTRVWWKRYLGYFAIVVVLFYAVEDIRGYYALKKAKEEYPAAGFRLDLDEIRGPAIPDEENFAASEIVRKAYEGYDDGSFVFLSDIEIPIPRTYPDELEDVHGFHGSFLSLEDYFLPGDSNKKRRNKAHRIFSESTEELEFLLNALARPDCDWTVVAEGKNDGTAGPHLPLASTLNWMVEFAVAASPDCKSDPELAKLIAGSIDFARHIRTDQNLVGNTLGIAFLSIACDNIATCLWRDEWNANECRMLFSRIESTNLLMTYSATIEHEIAANYFLELSRSEIRTYASYLDVRFIDLPTEIWGVNLGGLESSINEALIYVLPRGWNWQNHALIYRGALNPEEILEENHFIGYSFVADSVVSVLPGVRNKVAKTMIKLRLAQIALNLEAERKVHGKYPRANEVTIPFPKYHVAYDENGRPVIWYSEEAFDPENAPDLESIPHDHLWRYPDNPK